MTQLKFHQLDENVYYTQKDKNTISFIFVQWLDCTKEDLEEDAIKDENHQYWVFQGDYITEKEINDIHQEALDLWNIYQDNIDDTNATEIIHNLTEKEAQDFARDFCKSTVRDVWFKDNIDEIGGFIYLESERYYCIKSDEPNQLLHGLIGNKKPCIADIENLVNIILEGMARQIDGYKNGSNKPKKVWEKLSKFAEPLNTVEMAILRQDMIEKLYKRLTK